MKKLILALITSGLLVACASQATVAQTEPLMITSAKGKVQTLQVEVVKTDEDRSRGLMNRTSLPPMQGMLFVFDTVQTSAFWMKNTLIPLDMIFMDEKGVITKIHPMAQPNSRTIIKSGGPVRAGLEINGGMAQKLGLKAGDIVHHDIFGNDLARP